MRSERSVYAYTGVTVQNDRSVLLYQVIEQQWICTFHYTFVLYHDIVYEVKPVHWGWADGFIFC